MAMVIKRGGREVYVSGGGQSNPFDTLPIHLLEAIVQRLEAPERRVMRAVSKSWWQHVGELVRNLRPTYLDSVHIQASFPKCTTLDLRSCVWQDQELLGLSKLPTLHRVTLPCGWSVSSTTVELLARGTGPNLQRLDLAGCKRINQASIHAVATECTQLSALHLSWCPQLSDRSLESIATIRHLTRLDFAHNPLISSNGLGRLSELPTLTELRLANCARLDDTTLSVLARLTGLRSLDVSHCQQITSQGMRHVTALQELTCMNLSDCPGICNSAVTSLGTLQSLTDLDLAHCWQLSGETLSILQGLRALSVANCRKMAWAGLTAVRHLPLTKLNVSGCKVRDASLCSLASLPLTSLDMSGCHEITEGGFLPLAKAGPTLTMLRISGPSFTDVSAVCLAHLTSLTELDLVDCKLTDFAMASLRRLTDLRSLELEGCEGLSDIGAAQLGQLTNLQKILSLARCPNVGARGLVQLTSLQKLELLDLDSCSAVTDEAVEALSQLPSLQEINLRGCHKVTHDGLACMAHRDRAPQVKFYV